MSTSSAVMLPYTASSVSQGRRGLLADLAGAGVDAASACDAGLALSELISNALRHARPLPGSVIRVSWELGEDYVEVAVGDGGGPTVPMVSRPAANALGGRGLGIVDRLSLRWGVRPSPDGTETTVWAALPLAADGERSRESVAKNGHRGHDRPHKLVIASSRDA